MILGDNYPDRGGCFLFIVRDWLIARKTESSRKVMLEEKKRVPSAEELSISIAETEDLKKALSNWKPRKFTDENLLALNRLSNPNENIPEGTVLIFLNFWSKKNYRAMAELFWEVVSQGWEKYVRVVREQFSPHTISGHKIVLVTDESPAVTEVVVSLETEDSFSFLGKFRLIFISDTGESTLRDFIKGNWRIVSVSLEVNNKESRSD